MGRIRHAGRDREGNEVYFLGNRANFAVLERAMRQIGRRLGVLTEDIVYVDAMPHSNLTMRFGGLAAQSLRLGGVGRVVSARGALWAYPALAGVVRRTREALRTQPGRRDREGPDPLPGAGREGAPGPGQEGAPGPGHEAAPGPGASLKVFYHCYGSSHTSVVAAAIHTRRLDPDRVPTTRELTAVKHFDRVRDAELGTVFPVGPGPDGEAVYVVGFGPGRKIIRQAVESFLELKGVPAEDYILVDALSRANFAVRAGGVISRRFGLVSVGRPLAALGIRQIYRGLGGLATETRAEVSRRLGR